MPPKNHNDPITEIEHLRQSLSKYDRALPPHQLRKFASQLTLSPSQWQSHVTFHGQHFCYKTLFQSAYFEVNLIGWRPGQSSSIHHHIGSACCVLVLDGLLTNRDYRVACESHLIETAKTDLTCGEVLTRFGTQIHSCGNEQKNVDLTTLHLYSPPLRPLAERYLASQRFNSKDRRSEGAT